MTQALEVLANGEDSHRTVEHAAAERTRSTTVQAVSGAGAPAGGEAGYPTTATDGAGYGTARSRGDSRLRREVGNPEGAAAKAAVDRTEEPERGLTVRDIVEDAKWFSAQASTNARYLAVAGFAVVWVLAEEKATGLRSWTLTAALVLLALALMADFFHYSVATNRLSKTIDRASADRLTMDSPAPIAMGETDAGKWFTYKRWFLAAGYLALLLGFIAHVYPEVWRSIEDGWRLLRSFPVPKPAA